jgi:hypothetical protein
MAMKVLLIHGVGLPSANLFGAQLPANLDALRLPRPPEISQFDWHALVEKPYTDSSFYNPNHLAQLMRGFLGLAGRGHPVLSSLRVLDFLLLPLPCALWLAGAMILRCARPSFSDTALPLAALQAARWIAWKATSWPIPSFAYASAPAVLGIYACLLLTTALMLAIGVMIRSGTLNAVRFLAALLIRPITFFASLTVRPVMIGFVMVAGIFFTMGVLLRADPQLPIFPHESLGVVPLAQEEYSTIYLAAMILGFAVLFAVAAVTYFLGKLLILPFKVLADVACYLGDPDYSATLLENLDNRIKSLRLGAGELLILVGHSLGSLIALDWLQQSKQRLERSSRIRVVTMGSPLRRFVSRFCAPVFPAPDRMAAELANYFPNFYWLNVYRPLDPIGAGLFRRATAATCDASTGQWRKIWMTAHTSYWDDTHALEIVRSHLLEVESSSCAHLEQVGTEPAPGSAPAARATGWEPAAAAIQFSRCRVQTVARVLAFVGACLLGASASHAALAGLDLSADHELHRWQLGRLGIETTGWLYRYERMEGFASADGDPMIVQLDYTALVFRVDNKHVAYAIDDTRCRNNHWKLATLEGSPLPSEGAVVVEKMLGQHSEKTARRWPVTVRYLPADPSQFDVVELELLPTYSWMRTAERWGRWLAALVAFWFVSVGSWYVLNSSAAIYCGDDDRAAKIMA